MKLGSLLLLVASLTACTKVQPTSAQLQTAHAESGCSLASSGATWPATLHYGDQQAVRWLYNLDDCQRRALLIHGEGAAISTGQLGLPGAMAFARQLIPMPLRYLDVPLAEVDFDAYGWLDGKLVTLASQAELQEIAEDTGVLIRGSSLRIPVHPTTRSHHPLIQSLLDKGYPLTKGPDVIATMSRSVWYRPEQGATTIKMGTDFVHGRSSPNKLTDVLTDVVDLQDVTQNTSIPELMATIDVGYLTDREAISIKSKEKDAGTPPYAIALRDYRPLLQDKHRIYIPQAILESRGMLTTGEGCEPQYRIPYGFQHSIHIPKAEMEKILFTINSIMARIIAIHHANGYMPIDFHGQNVMVGIPLSPEVPARLVIRDVADIYPFDFQKTYAKTWAGIKRIQARGFKQPDLDRWQVVAYKDQMKKMGFTPPRSTWDQVPSSMDIRQIAVQYYEYRPNDFWAQVKTFREKRCQASASKRIVTQCVARARAYTATQMRQAGGRALPAH